MRIGTPGFVGARLKEAREARGLTGIALADLLGVTRAAVSQYETGEASPSPEIMRKISEDLDLPIRFFLEKTKERPHNATYFRSMASTTKTARLRAQRRFDWLLDIVDFLKSYVKFPALKSDFAPPADPAVISPEMIRDFALQTRREWGLGLGPISNVVWLLENSGVVVSRYGLGADELDAFSEWGVDDPTPYVVLNSEKQSAARSRFDAGHELGHLILHRNVEKKAVNKPDQFKLIEEQAHRFAGEFLLPRDAFSADFYAPSLDAFRSLQAKWKLSVSFMIKRSCEIGLINKDQEALLYRSRNRRGWGKREPFDEEAEPESPRFLRKSVEALVSRGVIAAHEIPFQLVFNPKDIESLTGLAPGYFSHPSREDSLTELFGADESPSSGTDGAAKIIRFPGVG